MSIQSGFLNEVSELYQGRDRPQKPLTNLTKPKNQNTNLSETNNQKTNQVKSKTTPPSTNNTMNLQTKQLNKEIQAQDIKNNTTNITTHSQYRHNTQITQGESSNSNVINKPNHKDLPNEVRVQSPENPERPLHNQNIKHQENTTKPHKETTTTSKIHFNCKDTIIKFKKDDKPIDVVKPSDTFGNKIECKQDSKNQKVKMKNKKTKQYGTFPSCILKQRKIKGQ